MLKNLLVLNIDLHRIQSSSIGNLDFAAFGVNSLDSFSNHGVVDFNAPKTTRIVPKS